MRPPLWHKPAVSVPGQASDAVLAPAGILEVDNHQLNVIFGTSRDTSDFVADCLELWWNNRRAQVPKEHVAPDSNEGRLLNA